MMVLVIRAVNQIKEKAKKCKTEGDKERVVRGQIEKSNFSVLACGKCPNFVEVGTVRFREWIRKLELPSFHLRAMSFFGYTAFLQERIVHIVDHRRSGTSFAAGF